MVGLKMRYARELLRLRLHRMAGARAAVTRGLAEELKDAARAFSAGDRAAYDRVKQLTGTTVHGKRIMFRPADVWSRPLTDSNGTLIAVTFEHDSYQQDLVRWAAHETRKADTEVVPREDGKDQPPEDAPWADAVRRSGRPPKYTFIHGDEDGDRFEASINQGTEADEDWIVAFLDGREGGEMFEAHENSARLMGRNPADEHVLVACRTAATSTSAAPVAAEYLHSTGLVTGRIHAPTDTAYTPLPKNGEMPSDLPVKRDSPGRKLFETYSAPERGAARPEDS